MKVVGVDGCPRGWVAVEWDIERRTLTPSIHWNIADLLMAHHDADKIGIDIPIGLAEGVARRCDIEARKALGPRKSSVFPAPDRRVLFCATYAEALAMAKEVSGKGMSRQAYGICAKIAEVNAVMSPARQEYVIEVHPEVSFWRMAHRQPMRFSKKKLEGFDERLKILADSLDIPAANREIEHLCAGPARSDDVLDAMAVAWTARRAAEGRAQRFPAEPEVDSKGLRMEIVY
jgi:predicted RNase H-like nuclease